MSQQVKIVNIEGAKELKELLQQMEKDFGTKETAKVLITATKQSLQPALTMARALTPKDTGALAASLRIEGRKPSKRDKRSVYVNETDTIIATITTAPPSKFVKVYDTEASYAAKKDKYKKVQAPDDARHIAMEFGTAKTPMQPYLRPSLESTAGTVLTVLGQSIKTIIYKYRSKNFKG